MSKQDIIDEIAENLGYVHSMVDAIRARKTCDTDASLFDSELTVLAIYCECYIERCFESLEQLSG
jgi:hypothetical protein